MMKSYFLVGAVALSAAPAAVPSNGASIQVVPQVSGFRLRDPQNSPKLFDAQNVKKQVKDQIRQKIDAVLREKSGELLNNALDELNLDANLKNLLKKVGISLGDLQVAASVQTVVNGGLDTASEALNAKTDALVDSLADAVLAKLPTVTVPTKEEILAAINEVVNVTAIKTKILSYVKGEVQDNFLAFLADPKVQLEVLKNKLVEQAKDQVKDQVRKQLELKSKTEDLLKFITENETMKKILSPFGVNDDDLKKVSEKVAEVVSKGSENIIASLTDKAMEKLMEKVNLDDSEAVQKLVDLFKNSETIKVVVEGKVEEYLQGKVREYLQGKAAEYFKGGCICETVKKLLPCLKEKSE